MTPSFRRLLLSTAALAVALTAGCAEGGTPLAPVGPPLRAQGAGELDPIARYRQRPVITIAWAKKWIGPEGGRLAFQGFVVEVPPGAVKRTTLFSIRLPVDPRASERVLVEFGPHGSKFSRPVTIEFPYANTDIYGSPAATVLWWNNGWVDMGATITPDGQRLRTRTDHFSEYGTSASRIGTITVSGG